MAKITDLAAVDQIDGTEFLPIVQGGATKRATMSALRALIVPFLQGYYRGEKGDPGPAGNVAATRAQLRAAPTTNTTMLYDGYPWSWDPAAVANDLDAISSAGSATGAWTIQSARGVNHRTVGGTIRRLLSLRLDDAPLCPEDFGAIGDGVADDSAALQAMVDEMMRTGRDGLLGYRRYRITRTIKADREIRLRGRGKRQSMLLLDTGTPVFALAIDLSAASAGSCVGAHLSGFGIRADLGSVRGNGLRITTNHPAAISASEFCDLHILNVHTGLDIDGVVYMSKFARITVSGSVTGYGVRARRTAAPNGIEMEVIYNKLENIEVTEVRDGAWAFHMTSYAMKATQLTCDGCCVFSGPYTHLDTITIEHMSAAVPPSKTAMFFDQIANATSIAILSVPTAKCDVGLRVLGSCNISNVRFAGVGQPDSPLAIDAAATGILSVVQTETAPVRRLSAAQLGRMLVVGCDDVTDYSFEQSYRSWTPTFPGWDVPPTVNSAQALITGREVTVTINAFGGKSGHNAIIGSLPRACDAQGVGIATATNTVDTGDASAEGKKFTAAIFPNASVISSIPARNLTGVYWQLSARYPRA